MIKWYKRWFTRQVMPPLVGNFFTIIYECIQLLVDKNLALLGDIMDIGIYLLEFHPHLWTLVANSTNFSLEKYLLLLEPKYYEFLLTKYFFCPNPEDNIDITTMDTLSLTNRGSMASRTA